jgi:hypothetical protein
LSLSVCHWTGCHGETSSVRKLDQDAEKLSTCFGPAEDLIERVLPCGLDPANQRPAETGFLELFRLNVVPGDMLDPVFRPDDLIDSHSPSLSPSGYSVHDTYPTIQNVGRSKGRLLIVIAHIVWYLSCVR